MNSDLWGTLFFIGSMILFIIMMGCVQKHQADLDHEYRMAKLHCAEMGEEE